MRIILTGLLLIMSLLARANDTLTVTVDPAQPLFQVTLPSNPTTGYQWTVENYDPSLLNLKSSQYIAPQKKLMGAEGNMIFNFALTSGKAYPTSTTITFKYARPWESGPGTLKTVTVNFTPDN
ncbi:protease inhibitor I42 family protein [Legionella fairfieldensis]|uniref:protease inhibitor I42 family protein n=1 Tax=Legionella fairfieldensis TaxID=45064 RepID=UPI00048C83B3|nr:protease inhibitor I42 family protein [Legionella fairfieldensis]